MRRNSKPPQFQNWWVRLFGALIVLFVLALILYQIPAVNNRLAWRVDNLRTRISYYFNPPDEAVFVPGEREVIAAAATAAATAVPSQTPAASPTAAATSAPLPEAARIDNFEYVDQHNRWNYCGPANLTMALNYWGWGGNRDDVAAYVKPGINNTDGREDKNVMPYEMEDFVESQTGLQAVVRVGGEAETLKRLIAAGFPVIAEKGYYEVDYTGKLGWLGHYQFVTGYDDTAGHFIVQDTYLREGDNGTGANMEWPYEDFLANWRSFNYLFIVVYPEEQRQAVIDALGPWADEEWANQHALEIAKAETETLSGNDQFFAWFNVGSSHVRLLQYVDAAFAYDFAFELYDNLGGDSTTRPYRIMWYQTGPYFAYYYSGRYQDTISLANFTLFETINEPTLEESLYWRALAYQALGEIDNAVDDLREAVRLNPNFGPGYAALADMGAAP